MASGPITSWQIDGGKMETVADFIFLGSKITADGDYNHEIKTHAPWKKSYGKPRQHIKNQSHHFADKGLYSQSYEFPSSHVSIWELDHKEGWALKNWCFRAVVPEKTQRVPWTVRRSNQSILKKINLDCSLEGLMWKLKLQYFGHLIQSADSLGKTLMLRKIEGRRRRGDRGWDGWMASPTRWTWVWAKSGK